MFDHEMRDAAERVLHACRRRGLKLVTAESCTGGLVAATLTAIAGSSDVVERAYVTYANEAKREMLGVPWDALMGHGAVSDPGARAMAAPLPARASILRYRLPGSPDRAAARRKSPSASSTSPVPVPAMRSSPSVTSSPATATPSGACR